MPFVILDLMPFDPSSSGEIQPLRLPMRLTWIRDSARAYAMFYEPVWLWEVDGNMSKLGSLAARSGEESTERILLQLCM